jgi:spore germination cell wall hydrolase CwlJ-like protein
VFALISFSGATKSYAALGDAPRCFPPAAPQTTADFAAASPLILELRPALPNDASEERDYLIRTIAFEATGEPEEGMAAVAHVVLNRMRLGIWGSSIKEVVTRPWQFEPWMTRRKEMVSLAPDDPRYQSAARIADAVLAGEVPDPTAGATHFLNPVIVRERRGGSLPSWASGEGQPIGRHTFYTPDEGDAVPERPTPFPRIMASSDSMLTLVGGVEATLLQAGGDIFATGRADGACGRKGLTAESSDLPAVDLVQLDAG